MGHRRLMGPPPLRFVCPSCGKGLSASAERAGTASRCPGCAAEVLIPAAPTTAQRGAPLASRERVTVTCLLCDTRMEVPVRHVGKKIKCPDCGSLTLVRPPAPKRPKPKPAAPVGDGYELYEGDQPYAADLIAAQPERATFECQLCATRMDVPLSAIGKRVICPDCGAKTRVPAPAPKGEKARLVAPGREYQLDASAPPTAPLQQELYAEHAARPRAGFRELSEAKARRAKGRPKPPRFALVVGVLRMWRSSAMTMAMAGLSLTLAAITALGVVVLGLLAAGGMSAAFGVVFVPIPLCLAVLWAAAMAVILIELVVESSEGNDTIDNWPQADPHQLGGPLAYAFTAAAAAALPGSLAARWLPPETAALVVTASFWLLLPWVVLSQLEQSAAFAVLSPKLLRTARYAPLAWLGFYLLTAGLLGGVGALVWQAAPWLGEMTPAVLAPVIVFTLLTYARLLGRLSWIAADATPDRPSIEAGDPS